MTKILLDGRTDVETYFKSSGVFDSERLDHTPLLAFIVSNETVKVRIIDKPAELLSLADDTAVMGQWRGEWRSDFFQFTVGQYRQFVEAKLERLKSARNVVKELGPRGGFRFLSYEFVDERGTVVHSSTSSRAEAERLEAVFARYNVPVEVRKLQT
jgi:hypothetical protein